MQIIGCDLHTRFQQIAWREAKSGTIREMRLEHGTGEAEAFYRGLVGPVRIGIESSGYAWWFERLAGGPHKIA